MATPTWSEIWTVVKNKVKIAEDARAHFANQVTNFDTLEQDLEGDYQPLAAMGFSSSVRGAFSSSLATAAAQIFDAAALEIGKLIDSPNLDNRSLLKQDIVDYMITNSFSVQRRNPTYNSYSAGGGNVGTGSVIRLSTDEDGVTMEASHIELKTVKCIADGNMAGGQRHGERFAVYGVEACKDWLEIAGSGARLEFFGLHAGSGDGGSLLANSSFDVPFSGTSTDKISGWTIAGTASNITQRTAGVPTEAYRSHPGTTTDYAIEFTANEKITQKITVSGTKLKQRAPYVLQVAYMRKASATGNLIIRMGSQTATATIGSATNDTWTILRIAIGTGMWYRNFVEDDLNIEIETTSLATGTVYVDDVLFAEWTPFDGTYLAYIGGATPARLDDVYTVTDTGAAAGTGKIQWWSVQSGWGYWPHSATPTITDPS